MKRIFIVPIIFILLFCLHFACGQSAQAEDAYLITSVDELTGALMNAKDGDTILVGDITFNPMPNGIILVPHDVTVRSGKDTNAVFTNATFALNGSNNNSDPLKVKFENIDFRGDCSGMSLDPDSPPLVSSELPDIMKTMCAAVFKNNVDASFIGCSFEGYHYGYGGVINAIYPSGDNKDLLNLKLDNCSFRNNAAKYGGCIYLSGYGHNINLDACRCVFDGNTAATGGAVWAQDADIRLTDCSLTGNLYLNIGFDAPDGGALALYNCAAELDGCLIANNSSGRDGAGILCEITPFKTLIMKNCTVIGNNSAEDEGISVVLAKTNFDTAASVHIYFSSLFGKQNLAESAELFGCLIVDKNIPESVPAADNGFCLTMTPESAQISGLDTKTPEHVSLSDNEYLIPNKAVDCIAGGKFSVSLGALRVGDNYEREAEIIIKNTPGHTKTATLKYGDELLLEKPKRKGYSFAGWEYPKGISVESGKIFIGGYLPEAPVTARWHFVLSENLYVIWIPLIVLAAVGLASFALWRRKREASAVSYSDENLIEGTAALPEDWIDRVCEKPEITAKISKRETEVLHKLLEGRSRKQIADDLVVTEATIKKHSASIYSKLNVHNRTELIYKLTKQ